MKLWQLGLALLLVLLIADVFRSAVHTAVAPEDALPAQEAEPPPDSSSLAETWGAEGGPVELQAYLPRGQKTAELVVSAFRTVVAENPKSVRAEVIDYKLGRARLALQMRGIKVPVVAVNGKTAFTVRLKGKPVKVQLADVRRLKTLPLDEVFRQIAAQELKTANAKGPTSRRVVRADARRG
jgi:hypothetical protein